MVAPSIFFFFFFSSRPRHTRFDCDSSSDVCSSDLQADPDSASRRRLVRLASRPALRDTIAAQTRSLASTLPGFNLRVALLEEQTRRDDIASLLRSEERRVGKECRTRRTAHHG